MNTMLLCQKTKSVVIVPGYGSLMFLNVSIYKNSNGIWG